MAAQQGTVKVQTPWQQHTSLLKVLCGALCIPYGPPCAVHLLLAHCSEQ